MGAKAFITYSTGKTAQEAFYSAVNDHFDEPTYSGTIAEKEAFIEFTLPKKVDATDIDALEAYIDTLIDTDERIEDKAGPAGCINLGPSVLDLGKNRFVFFGWSSY